MLSIISGLLGFATSGLPSVLSFFQQKGDQAHEREMAKLQNEQAMAMAQAGFVAQEKIEAIKLEEVNAETYAQERVALYDYANKEAEGASQWIINLRASVRPVIAYAFMFILLFTDIVGLIWAINTMGFSPEAMEAIFSTEEMAILASIIGFYFGSRRWGK
jgi:hypothetical protein